MVVGACRQIDSATTNRAVRYIAKIKINVEKNETIQQ